MRWVVSSLVEGNYSISPERLNNGRLLEIGYHWAWFIASLNNVRKCNRKNGIIEKVN